MGKSQVRFEKRANRTDVFPIAVEQMDVHLVRADRRGENFLAEVGVVGLAEQVDEHVAIEQVNAHARQTVAAFTFDAASVDPGRIGVDEFEFFDRLRLFQEALHATGVVQPHDAELRGLLVIDRQGCNRHVGARLAMRDQHVVVVHVVQLIARQDQHMVDPGLLQIAQMLAHGIGRSLVPQLFFVGLLGRQDFDEAFAKRVEVVGPANVAVQADRIELRQHIDAVHVAVQAVRQRDIDQPVLSGQRDRRFRTELGQRQQARAATASEHEGDNAIAIHGRVLR